MGDVTGLEEDPIEQIKRIVAAKQAAAEKAAGGPAAAPVVPFDMYGEAARPGASPMPMPTFGSLAPPMDASRDIAPRAAAGSPYALPETGTVAEMVPSVGRTPGASPAPAAPPPAPLVPPSPKRSAGGFGETLLAFLGGLSGEGGIKAALAASNKAEAENLTAKLLMSKGLNEEDVWAAIKNPQLMPSMLNQAFPQKVQTLKEGERLVADMGGRNFVDVTPGGGDPTGKTAKGRSVLAEAMGLKKDTPAYTSYVLTGKLPPDVKPPAGYRFKNAEAPGEGMEPVPGGPADIKFTEAKQTALARLESATSSMEQLQKQIHEVRTHAGLSGNYGLTGVLPNIPGTAAADAWQLINRLKASGSFATLQAMREASKTGGALGNVSNQENKKLEDAFAALDPKQSEEQTRRQLDAAFNQIEQAKEQLRNAYTRQYNAGDMPAATPTSTVKRSPEAESLVSEARDALSKGAPRDAVLKRLRERGIDPAGL
ncbi:MAG: hypothetical protein KA472_11435 [Pseudomonadales bacterium]|nr:hypothetical protein [Pseudomonadales bacterium]